MLGLFMGAAILGIIIAVMEQDEFPGWGKMIICVLAAVVPEVILNNMLPSELFLIGLAGGAVCAAGAIMATCGMELKRACIASGIYLAIQVVLTLAVAALVQS